MDTGADKSLLKPHNLDKTKQFDPESRVQVKSVSGSTIQTMGAVQAVMYVGVSESKVPYFFATKILHIIRCLFLQLLLTSFTIFSRSHLLC